MADIIQKATEWDKQCAAFKKARPLDTLHQTHILQPKYDGCHMLIDTTARRAFSRTNETVRSCDHLIERCAQLFGTGWVVQGEAYIIGAPFPFIGGKYRQHAPFPDMEYVVYDALPTWAFKHGSYNEPYWARFDDLREVLGSARIADGKVGITSSNHEPGADVQAIANKYVSLGGYDGLILRDPNALWVAGPARNGEIIKVKPSVTLDLRVTEVSMKYGEKTGREVYTVTVSYRGVETEVGSGMPHKAHEVPAVGQIIEVECMAVNPNNTLREPRFKAIRFDKEQPDE